MVVIDKSLPKDQRILLAAEEIFSQKGYVQTTLDEIIALADTGKGTLYKYFGNKDNLFYTLVQHKLEPFLKKLQTIVAAKISTEEKIRSYMLALLPFVDENSGLYRILWYEVSGNQQGFHPIIFDDGSWKIESFYKMKLTENELENLLRYRKLISVQVQYLIEIIKEGMDAGFMKCGHPMITAHHLFGGVAMSVLHYRGEKTFTHQELANLIVDRFLYGHAQEEKRVR